VFAPDLLEDAKEQVAGLLGAESLPAPVATAGDEMKVTLQPPRHCAAL